MASIKKELDSYGIIPRKGLGQHFLIDRNIIEKIVRTAGVDKEDIVLEVGPGLGEMTVVLSREAKKVVAIEIDPKLISILKEKVDTHPNIRLIQADILKVDFKRLFSEEGERMKVVANLPYQISTPLLFRFIEFKDVFSTLTLMLQKEVAGRIIAAPGGKEYSPLSILVQAVSDPFIRFTVRPSAFFPPPRVDSAVVSLAWRAEPVVEPEWEEWFRKVVRSCFSYRRKMLINALKHSGLELPQDLDERLGRTGIDPKRRPETLAIQEFLNLAKVLKE